MRRFPYFWATIGFWFLVGLVCQGWVYLDQQAYAAELVKEIQRDDEMTFAKHLALNPEMFAAADYNTARPMEEGQYNWKGGALGDPQTVRVIMFLKRDALERIRRQLLEEGLPDHR